jgi:predicted ArsR family transcriptional regulator
MRKPILKVTKNDKLVPASKAVVEALRNLDGTSRFLKLQIQEMGYIVSKPVKSGKRGRPAFEWILTGKGNGLLAISKNWGKKKELTSIELMAA